MRLDTSRESASFPMRLNRRFMSFGREGGRHTHKQKACRVEGGRAGSTHGVEGDVKEREASYNI